MPVDPIDQTMNNVHNIGRYEGLKEGVTMFAWWKDGVQYVGTCGTTLKEALNKIDKMMGFKEN